MENLRTFLWLVVVFLTPSWIFFFIYANSPPGSHTSEYIAQGTVVLILDVVAVVALIATSEKKQVDPPEALSKPPSYTHKSKSEQLPSDWKSALEKVGMPSSEVDRIVEMAFADRSGNIIPRRNQVFNAFQQTLLTRVKVVILGQDPYPNSDKACGLAFSVPRGVEIPYSLHRIYNKMYTEFVFHPSSSPEHSDTFSIPNHGDLGSWAWNGVLLLNSALTVVEGKPGTHSDLWKPFTRKVLEVLNDIPEPVVFLLWGDDANALADSIPLNNPAHKVVRSAHPRRELPSRYPPFADVEHFAFINSFLTSQGRDEGVNWSLK